MSERKFMGFGYYEGMEKTYSDRIKELMTENKKLQATNAELEKTKRILVLQREKLNATNADLVKALEKILSGWHRHGSP